MADTISLFEFLQNAPPAIPLSPVNPGDNTTNTAYGAQNVQSLGVWTSFNLATIRKQYENLLVTTRIQAHPFPTSPPQAIIVGGLLRGHVTEPRIRRALRSGFNQLNAENLLNGFTPISFSRGEAALTPGGFKPDIAYFIEGSAPTSGPNRAPGDVKPSWKWSTAFQTGTLIQQREFCQVQPDKLVYETAHTRYGVFLTDLEMVAI